MGEYEKGQVLIKVNLFWYLAGKHEFFESPRKSGKKKKHLQLYVLAWCPCWKFWNSTSCEELIHWKRLWCWEGLGAGGEGDNRGWDGWMASLTRWTWVWVNSGSWWWTGRPGVLRFMGSQRVVHDWATELNWCMCISPSSTKIHPEKKLARTN